MKKIKKYIYEAVMYFSLQEREKREYSNYKKEYNRLKELSEDELNARYINTQSKYGYKKNLFSLFIITVLITALTSAWSFFSGFSKNLLQIMVSDQTDIAEAAKVVLFISGIVFIAVIIAIVVTVVFYLQVLCDLNKTLLMIEEIRKKQEKPSNK